MTYLAFEIILQEKLKTPMGVARVFELAKEGLEEVIESRGELSVRQLLLFQYTIDQMRKKDYCDFSNKLHDLLEKAKRASCRHVRTPKGICASCGDTG